MQNQQTEKALRYHTGTKHSYESIRRNAHFLDWPNRPLPFKTYRDLDPNLLPRERESTGGPAVVDLKSLRDLLYYSAGITRRRQYPGGEILFRARRAQARCMRLNCVVRGPRARRRCLYFHLGDMAMRRLREGDFARWGCVRQCAADRFTGTYWRNAWKYIGISDGQRHDSCEPAMADGWTVHLGDVRFWIRT
jgi:hypothetical protein